MSFSIKLPLFEGPFDLLLFFIERDELDIYDIPISRITNDFLDYLHQLESLNIEVASEFILVAATLMRIKAKMLLPRPELDKNGEEIDPREELIAHLLEYKKYKSVVGTLAAMEHERQTKENRGNTLSDLKLVAARQDTDLELQDLDLYKLLKVYQRVMKRFALEQSRPVHQVIPYPYSIELQRSYLRNLVHDKGSMSFEALLAATQNKIEAIFNFLAILELLQAGEIGIKLGEGYNNFVLVAVITPVKTTLEA
jgi:segregation and condensation protein A